VHRLNTTWIQPLWASLALWLVFSFYWSLAARNAAPTKSAEPRASFLFHQTLISVSLVLLFWRVPVLADRRWLPDITVLVLAGTAVQAAFMLLAFWARWHLGQNWSAAITAKVGHQLIRSGPYRFVRHPIYAAMLGMYFGTAVASGEWHALAGLFILAVAYWRKIRSEERNLSAVFGTEYDSFRRNSWALIPWLV